MLNLYVKSCKVAVAFYFYQLRRNLKRAIAHNTCRFTNNACANFSVPVKMVKYFQMPDIARGISRSHLYLVLSLGYLKFCNVLLVSLKLLMAFQGSFGFHRIPQVLGIAGMNVDHPHFKVPLFYRIYLRIHPNMQVNRIPDKRWDLQRTL